MTSWLRAQKKSELVDIAETIGLKNVASLKKADLESSIDEYLTENVSRLSSDPKLAPYYNTRGKSGSSPIKREPVEPKVSRRRMTKSALEEIVAADDGTPAGRSSALALTRTPARTPARALSFANRIAMPSSPAEVVQVVDRGAVAVRERVVSIYADSGITEVTQVTRESLSTVNAIIGLVSLFEWFFLRPELMANRYAFTLPAIGFLGTSDYPVQTPDFSVLLSATFWSPLLVWLFVGTLAPALFGFFFNLSAASGSHHSGRGRSRPFSSAEYIVDPLTFSVAKALLVFVVLAQGATFGGWVDGFSVARINSALYGGWKGALVGTAITGLASLYDAVLRK
ncbi:hypothetical protein CMQ_6066 [Grosmannia clavigera kw1407]|uniref:Rho termination factor N-terminal domain-containing protein n=1 Tax=Grosmannia clavigera (strain kw1407 / UAMH 11150) TaxID=655863 RepID=F0XLP6_GROCL|nr:uncharacterized protein CMQ_6066 [Grosmannia clavigera kw1407]EFX01124.1 hypothetical protein CMQ_6066 [Grosmannia clavigera kw1407]